MRNDGQGPVREWLWAVRVFPGDPWEGDSSTEGGWGLSRGFVGAFWRGEKCGCSSVGEESLREVPGGGCGGESLEVMWRPGAQAAGTGHWRLPGCVLCALLCLTASAAILRVAHIPAKPETAIPATPSAQETGGQDSSWGARLEEGQVLLSPGGSDIPCFLPQGCAGGEEEKQPAARAPARIRADLRGAVSSSAVADATPPTPAAIGRVVCVHGQGGAIPVFSTLSSQRAVCVLDCFLNEAVNYWRVTLIFFPLSPASGIGRYDYLSSNK